MLKKINRMFVIMFMGHKPPHCGLMDILVKEIHLYSLMPWWVNYSWHRWKYRERLLLEGQLLKDFFDLKVSENRFLIVDQDNCNRNLQPLKRFLLKYNIKKSTQIPSTVLDEFSQTEHSHGTSTQIKNPASQVLPLVPFHQPCPQSNCYTNF